MRTIRIIFFRGKGVMSALIRWQTRGKSSHVGILFEDNVFFESWCGSAKHLWRNGGVAQINNYKIPDDATVFARRPTMRDFSCFWYDANLEVALDGAIRRFV